jgi:hypothetical protein
MLNKEKRKIRNHRYYLKNKNKIKKWNREYCIKNKERDYKRIRNYHLKRNYNININELNDMVLKQNNKCKICKNELKKLHIDHNHKTNKVRGILCEKCNLALGLFQENISIILNAAEYLKQDQSSNNIIQFPNINLAVTMPPSIVSSVATNR